MTGRKALPTANPKVIQMKNYFSAAELAKYFGVSQGTIWRWAKDGILPQPTRLTPKTVRWPAAVVEAFEKATPTSSNNRSVRDATPHEHR